MLGDGLGDTVEDALQVVQLAGVLYLDDDDFALAVLGFDVHTVELVVLCLLVAFAFEYFQYMDGFSKEYGQKTFEHAEIRFLAEQTFDCPVKSDILVLQSHCECPFCCRTVFDSNGTLLYVPVQIYVFSINYAPGYMKKVSARIYERWRIKRMVRSTRHSFYVRSQKLDFLSGGLPERLLSANRSCVLRSRPVQS